MNDSPVLPPLSSSKFSPPSNGTPTSSKAKRNTLNIVSPKASSVPRPLHLPLGSIVGSSSSPSTPNFTSPSPSPGPSLSTGASAINSDIISIIDGVSTGSNNGKPTNSTGSTSRAPSPSPLSPVITGLRKHPSSRRQSSISYISSNGHSPSSVHFSINRRDSVDGGLLRSPLSSVHTTPPLFGDAAGSGGLVRSNSLGGRRPRTPRSPAVGDRSSTGSLLATQSNVALDPGHLKERPPVTLAEKHAELLHFIAQKESKCLELRSQLAVHEAELLQLKRKWERIVNRGFEKALSPSNTTFPNTSTSPVPLSTSLLYTSPNSLTPNLSPSSSSTSNPSSYFPTLTPATNAPGAAVVLEGIKEGVQGMSRLIAAGLESIVLVNGPATPAANDANAKGTGKSEPSTANGPFPLRLGSVSAQSSRRRNNDHLGHEQKDSQSSSSTTTSATSSATFSSLLSASSATSAGTSTGASIGGSSTSGNTTTKSASPSSCSFISGSSDNEGVADADAKSEFGDFEDGQSRSASASVDQLPLNDEHEQVLMVHDTGATPTMSPNPAFQRRRPKQEPVEVERLVQPSASGNRNANEKEIENLQGQEEFDWDDGWGEPASEVQPTDLFETITNSTNTSSASVFASTPSSSKNQGQKPATTPKSMKSPPTPLSLQLAPVSSIPGLASMGMGMNAPSAQQMSSWVGSVGKRWGEIKGSTAFTKNQKRASLLISDMQHSIVSALGSPASATTTATTATTTPSSSSSTHQSQKRKTPTTASSASSFSSNAFHAPPAPRGMSTSLLDDSDDESFGESGGDADADGTVRMKLGAVMVPDSLSPTTAVGGQANPALKTPAKTNEAKGAEDEDEWNW